MIRKDLASKFVERLAMHLDFKINIMDVNGIIIASSDKKRINTFHESAYEIIKNNEKIIKIYPTEHMPSGVKPGVNLPILYNNKSIGVVGLTGNPDEVLSVAYAIKTSVETMIEYELYKDKILMRRDKKNQFINLLLYELIRDNKIIEELAEKLSYRSKIYRAPIIISLEEGIISGNILEIVKKNYLHTKQDISCISIDHNILIFKSIKLKNKYIFSDYTEQIEEYIKSLSSSFLTEGIKSNFKYYVGNYENDFFLYRNTYAQIQWCLDNVLYSNKTIIYFHDYIEEYLISKIPELELIQVFSQIINLFQENKNLSLFKTLQAVYDSNMNLKKASILLGIHRNTIYQRLQKLKDILGVDPILNPSFKKYFYYLIHYLRKNKY